jgi:formate hydrogenlyase subunit 6/NADH:ubiquinone oxidoreductase subunit I
MLEMLEKICDGNGTVEMLDELERLANTITDTALCGLGQTAPNPILSTLRYFRDEYIAHCRDKKCPAGTCQKLYNLTITDACKGCTKCKRMCPVNAIEGEAKQLHKIDTAKCIKSGACIDGCPFKAIVKE